MQDDPHGPGDLEILSQRRRREHQDVVARLHATAEAAARFYARPGIRFPRIADIAPCEVAVALPELPTPAARAFAEVAIGARGRQGGSSLAPPHGA